MRVVICVSVLLIWLSTSGEASVYCYLCHWSKTAESHDICRSQNFNPSKAKTEMCSNGCQTETFFEGNETTMFSRQCSDKTVHVDECVMVELVGDLRRRNCYCSSNYCNSVSTITSRALLLLTAIVSHLAL